MFDTSKIKEGDTVVFKNGGKSKVYRDASTNVLCLAGWGVAWWKENGVFDRGNNHDLDIIEIIPKLELVVHECYVDYYPDGFAGSIRDTFKLANRNTGTSRICTFKITVTDGVASIKKVGT